MEDKKYITHEEAMKTADPWMRVRLTLNAHEFIVQTGNSTDMFLSRNELLKEIARYAKHETTPKGKT